MARGALILVAIALLAGCDASDRDSLPPRDAAPEIIDALDEDAAFAWYMRAARDGDPRAQYMVARSYRYGEGATQDETEAFKWYLAAAENQFIAAQTAVAAYYESGGPVARDFQKAIDWRERAAAQGAVASAYRLYELYRGTEGAPADRVLAYMWLYIAYEKGHGAAPDLLPVVEASLTEAEYQEGRRRAQAWLEQHWLKPPDSPML